VNADVHDIEVIFVDVRSPLPLGVSADTVNPKVAKEKPMNGSRGQSVMPGKGHMG
jgi:hypothetical protein